MTESIKQNKIAIILPCYNEEEVLPLTYRKLQKIIVELSKEDAQTYLVFPSGPRARTSSAVAKTLELAWETTPDVYRRTIEW